MTGTPMQNDRLDSFAAAPEVKPVTEPVPIERVNVPRDPALSAALPLGTYNRLVTKMHQSGLVSESKDMICWWYRHIGTDSLAYDFEALTPNRPNDPGKEWVTPPYVRVFVDRENHVSPFSYRLIPGDTVILESPEDRVHLASIRKAISRALNGR